MVAAAATGGGGIVPGTDWLDDTGKLINAHSGRVLWDSDSGLFIWHGMLNVGFKVQDKIVTCYTSPDLISWSYKGVALNTSVYISRPKVLRHSKGHYVMWMKATPGIAVAESSSPFGPFKLLSQPFTLFGAGVGGATAFVDPADIEKAYLIYSQKPGPANNNTRTMTVAPLTPDWRNVSHISATYAGHLEGPAVWYNQTIKRYYIWTSHTHGWKGSPAVVRHASSMDAEAWTPLSYNPTHNQSSWQSQSSDILAWPNSSHASLFIYIADRFIPFINENKSSRPVWLPMCQYSAGDLSVPWTDAWIPSPAARLCSQAMDKSTTMILT